MPQLSQRPTKREVVATVEGTTGVLGKHDGRNMCQQSGADDLTHDQFSARVVLQPVGLKTVFLMSV